VSVRFDHTIVHSHDKKRSAEFPAEILGLPPPARVGHFLAVKLADGASLDVIDAGDTAVVTQHYAFRVDHEDFKPILARLGARSLDFWADPFKKRPGEIYRHDGARGFYFNDPDAHLLEVLTRPSEGETVPPMNPL
jgi:catechol 2,3-dioxygenase-like lactoylglutathione lyase family enzyme